MSKDRGKTDIVAGGGSRIHRDLEPSISRAVKARYADQMAKVGWFRRMLLHIRIHREIQKELERRAPHGGLYARSRG